MLQFRLASSTCLKTWYAPASRLSFPLRSWRQMNAVWWCSTAPPHGVLHTALRRASSGGSSSRTDDEDGESDGVAVGRSATGEGANVKSGPPNGAFPWDTSVRLQGTVTAFKHRRGYGFVLAEGYTKKSWEIMQERLEQLGGGGNAETEKRQAGSTVAAAKRRQGGGAAMEEGVRDPALLPAGHDFFFTRGAMGGGFYITEGERVSFRVKQISEKDAASAGRHRRRHRYVSRGQLQRGEDDDAGGQGQGGHLFSAIGLRLYDPATGEEGRILPVAIQGVVTEWDATSGIGIISELDVDGNLHNDAPTFTVLLEDVDLSPVASSPDSYIDKGRYVKFCIGEPENTTTTATATDVQPVDVAARELKKQPERPRALRVILDINAERKRGVVRQSPVDGSSSSVGSEAAAEGGSAVSHSRRRTGSGFSSSVLPQQRGVIREMVERKYGFVVDDASGESIFFHVSEMVHPATVETLPQVGDCVSYDLETIHGGRHAGKKHCVQVRLLHQDVDRALDTNDTATLSPTPGAAGSTGTRKKASSTASQKRQQQKTKAAPKSLLDEFDLLD